MQERNPSIQHLTACGQIERPGSSENYVLVHSSRNGVWGGALMGTVRSLPVVVENRKEVVIPSVRVQHEYSHDVDFLYGRLLCSKICVVKNKWTKGGLQTGQKITISSCSVRCLSIVVLMLLLCFLLFRMGITNLRIGTLLAWSSQILNFTRSDPRQDGQSSPFTSSSQRVHGMRNCRASIVAETEKPFLTEHQRLYPLLFAF